MKFEFPREGLDFSCAGEAATHLKNTLQMIGISPEIVRRAIIVTYEAELNVIIHSYRGKIITEITPEMFIMEARDEGPGIADIDLAMQEGFSTVPSHIREMGFGAGMGLPNIKKFSDEVSIDSGEGQGTVLKATIYIKSGDK